MDKMEAFKTADKLKSYYIDNWHNHLSSWKYWLLVGILILPWIIFIYRVDKKRLLLIGFFGLMVSILSSFLDQIGVSFVLWSYPIKVVPAIATFTPASFGVLPVVFMLLYQHFNNTPKIFYLWVILFSAVTAFVAQPLLYHYGFYTSYHWHYAASFLTTIIIAVVSREATNKLYDLIIKHNKTSEGY